MQTVSTFMNDQTIEYDGVNYPWVDWQCYGTVIDPHWIITSSDCCGGSGVAMQPARFFLNVGSEATSVQIDQNGQIINHNLFLNTDSLFQVFKLRILELIY